MRSCGATRPFWLLLLVLSAAASPARPADGAERASDNLTVLDAVWREASARVFPAALADEHFTEAARRALEHRARNSADLYELAPALDGFLRSLGRSHAGFYHDRTLDHYLYRSMFTTRSLDEPPVHHAGLQHEHTEGRWVVRAVWDGYPAAAAGIRRGDVLLTANAAPYDPFRAFNAVPGPVLVGVQRGEQLLTVKVTPVLENPNRSLLQAMKNSLRIQRVGPRRVGYVHLWSGTHPAMLDVFLDILEGLQETDALVLDLRAGFGGTWYEYLDPFFASRDDFFSYAVLSRAGREDHRPGQRTDVVRYDKPMVVLIDGGTRSGKEALAFQFKRSGRAVVVGERTWGAFTGGEAVFTDAATPYFMMVPSLEYRLDGQVIEGVGVAPDVHVPYPLSATGPDPQLERALKLAGTLDS